MSITVILFTIATSIIMSREADKTDYNYSTLTTNSYLNEFLKPNPGVFKKIHSIENQPIKKSLVSGFQISQYYVHGVFEFDNLVKFYKNKPHKLTLGKYTFFTLNRFTNKYGITNTDLEKIQLLHPRGYTFITFFGGLFLDFGWYGVIIMFLYGMFQRYSYNQILINKNEFLPLFIFLLFVNFFMLTFNYLRGLGIYIILVCFLLIFVINFNKKIIFK
ncbi:hypothetical protein [Lutibacter sp. Hel_I_33_5]|uniref:hypothetical protein n=1 Tax=Lutibacter sp. Hel_I_33_5 TaxID=1566289 RepID=UPI001C985A63|nr:hypothetical protein [Lutibacter sp. Hel_I_33_5]